MKAELGLDVYQLGPIHLVHARSQVEVYSGPGVTAVTMTAFTKCDIWAVVIHLEMLPIMSGLDGLETEAARQDDRGP